MKKIILAVLFFFFASKCFSQAPYSNYWDETSEWRYVSGGWNGFQGYTDYTTTYFDGYEVIAGVSYWKEYTRRTEVTTDPWTGGTNIQTTFYTQPILTREDAAGNFYRVVPDSGVEVLTFSNQQILDAVVGDTFPVAGASCPVSTIETNYLGTRPLKRIKGSITGNNAGTLEGVGHVGNNCSMGIEYNGGINCYTKQGITLQFGTVDCASPLFPPALRTGLGTENHSTKLFGIYPNPTNGLFKINMPSSIENARFEIYAINGVKISEGIVVSQETVDISSFSSGVYIVKVSANGNSEYLKIVKD